MTADWWKAKGGLGRYQMGRHPLRKREDSNPRWEIVHEASEDLLNMLHISHTLFIPLNIVVMGSSRRHKNHRWRFTASLTLDSDCSWLWAKSVDVAFVATTSSLEHQGIISRDRCASLYMEVFNSWNLSNKKENYNRLLINLKLTYKR